MKILFFILSCIISFSFALSCSQNFKSKLNTIDQNRDKRYLPYSPKVIYGEDNRLDVYQVKNKKLTQLEKSVAGLVLSRNLTKNSDGTFKVKTIKYARHKKLCKSEKFYEQQSSTFCTGFLIEPDTLVTAGHCVLDQEFCNDVYFVFGLSKYSANKSINYSSIKSDNVYSCKELLYSVAESTDGQDFAVIKLDRKVVQRKPLKIRRYGRPSLKTKTVLIGKPAGIPTKIESGGHIIKHKRYKFVSNNDAYVGNSGSPIFNEQTGIVEGILVQGSLDYTYNKENDCNESNVCSSVKNKTICGGELSQYISGVLPYIEEDLSNNIFENNQKMAIPDNDPNGITSNINLTTSNLSNKEPLIHLNISHTWSGDLKVILTSPNDNKITLINKKGEFGENLVLTYGQLAEEREQLKQLKTSLNGTWTLRVVDSFSRDNGTLNSWAIEIQ